MSEKEECYKCGREFYGKAMLGHFNECQKEEKWQRINKQLESAAAAVNSLPQWMKDLEAERQRAWREENMCGDCPDDESDISTHRDRIKYWEQQAVYLANKSEDAKREAKSAKRMLRILLRNGKIRNA